MNPVSPLEGKYVLVASHHPDTEKIFFFNSMLLCYFLGSIRQRELSLCTKLRFFNHFFLATQYCNVVHLNISNYEFCQINQSKFEISKVYTSRFKDMKIRKFEFFENTQFLCIMTNPRANEQNYFPINVKNQHGYVILQ